MRDVLKVLVAVCVADRIFDLIMPSGSVKKQLKIVSGTVMTALLVKVIFGLFGR